MLRELIEVALRTTVSAVAFATSLVATRLFLQVIDISQPRLPAQAPEEIAGWYLLAGSIALAAAILLPARNLRGSFLIRWAALVAFLFLGFGVSTTIESSIFSGIDGTGRLIGLLFLPCFLLGNFAALLFKPRPSELSSMQPIVDAILSRTSSQWLWRLIVVIAVFPVTYFVFGILVSPIVSDYYARGISGLVLPEPSIIAFTQFLRGAMHLIAILPLVALWNGSQRKLTISLGLAFFVFVTAYDFVFAYQVPLVLVLTHGIEVLLSSLVYAWIVVKVLLGDGQMQRIKAG